MCVCVQFITLLANSCDALCAGNQCVIQGTAIYEFCLITNANSNRVQFASQNAHKRVSTSSLIRGVVCEGSTLFNSRLLR